MGEIAGTDLESSGYTDVAGNSGKSNFESKPKAYLWRNVARAEIVCDCRVQWSRENHSVLYDFARNSGL